MVDRITHLERNHLESYAFPAILGLGSKDTLVGRQAI